jgi:ABC-2 type transport system permease protein
MKTILMQVYSLWLRDMRHFFRQRSRVAGAIGQPFIFWLFLNAGFKRSFAAPGADGSTGYGEFLFPGIIALIALFSAVFSTMSIIEDRRSGFLQGVLVAPVPRMVLVFGKMLSGASLALAQYAVFMLLLPATSLHVTAGGIVAATGVLILVAMTLTNVGFFLSWKLQSTQGFHAIMNLILIPLWLLSGAFFPVGGASSWLQAVMSLNPMTYMLALFQHAFFLGAPVPFAPSAAVLPALAVTLLAGVAFTCTSTYIARK